MPFGRVVGLREASVLPGRHGASGVPTKAAARGPGERRRKQRGQGRKAGRQELTWTAAAWTWQADQAERTGEAGRGSWDSAVPPPT